MSQKTYTTRISITGKDLSINSKICLQTLYYKSKIEEICTKYAGYAKFYGNPRELNLKIPINS